jgi:hypothetical protein
MARIAPVSSEMPIVMRAGWLIGSRIIARVREATATDSSTMRRTSSIDSPPATVLPRGPTR